MEKRSVMGPETSGNRKIKNPDLRPGTLTVESVVLTILNASAGFLYAVAPCCLRLFGCGLQVLACLRGGRTLAAEAFISLVVKRR
jgi:hypothetical protein